MKDKELKPCPFCRGEARKQRLAKQWSIYCTNCGSEVVENTFGCNTTCQVTKKEILCVEKWNTRTSDKAIEEIKDENRKLAETLDFLDTFIRGCEINHDIGYVGYPAQERVSNALGKLNKE